MFHAKTISMEAKQYFWGLNEPPLVYFLQDYLWLTTYKY